MNILSLYDYSGNMVLPWAKAGHKCFCVDIEEQKAPLHKNITHIHKDIYEYTPSVVPDIIFAFPPCTHVAVSGAKHFKSKGPKKAAEAFGLLARCLEIIEMFDCPWMVENPVSTFDPWQYGDNYQKRTCLWTGNGFIMPAPSVKEKPKDCSQKIWKMPPSKDRARKRSMTPMGFAEAVFKANS